MNSVEVKESRKKSEYESAKKNLIRLANNYVELMKMDVPDYKEPEVITLSLIKDAFEYFYCSLKVTEPNLEEMSQNKKLEAFCFKPYSDEEIAKMMEEEDKDIDELLKPIMNGNYDGSSVVSQEQMRQLAKSISEVVLEEDKQIDELIKSLKNHFGSFYAPVDELLDVLEKQINEEKAKVKRYN